MSQYFPKLYKGFGGNINVKVDLSYYATKTDLKNATGTDTSNFALKSNLAKIKFSLKTELGKLHIDKLKPVPVDLSKLSDVVKNEVVKETVYDKLVAKVNNIATIGFVLKTKYETDKSDLKKKISDADKKISDTSGLVKKSDYNAKISEIESKILSISGLATTSALTAVKNKVPDVNSLVKKTDHNTRIIKTEKKVSDHNQEKYITTTEFNNLATGVFTARLAQ